jgi:hypothetical protein
MITRRDPFEDVKKTEVIQKVLQGYLLPLSDNTPDFWRKLVRDSTSIDPQARPTFAEILHVLRVCNVQNVEI